MIRIAIDGPGGAGKSSVAKLLAARLGILYVDTGALYRAIGFYCLSNGIDPKDAAAVERALPDIHPTLTFTDRQILRLNGEDVGDKIRTPEVSMAASAVSAIPAVRTFLLDTQRNIAKKNSVIMDGRDIGTVILPNADLKIFLVASPEARAKRRFEELTAKGIETTLEDVMREMETRDQNDASRAVAPCVKAEDAVLLDNSNLTLEGTADAIADLLNRKLTLIKSGRFYMRMHHIFAGVVRFFQRIHIHGAENIPAVGGVLVCANHIAIRDPFLIAASFHRPVRYLAKKELFRVPVVRHCIRALGAVPVDRGNNDVAALRTSVELLRLGEAVSLFPQGHRYPGVDPTTTPRKNGAALIAYRAKVAVIPVCIKVKNVKYGFLRRKDIYIGKPISCEELGFVHGGSKEYEAATDKIFSAIAALGGYGEKTQSTDGGAK